MITNDGATILKQMEVVHPTAKMVRIFIKISVFLSFISLLKFQRLKILRPVTEQLQLS